MKRWRYPVLGILLVFFFSAQGTVWAKGLFGLVGGGRVLPGTWYDEVFKWLIAESGRGKIVFLSCDEEVNHLGAYFLHLGAGSVKYLKLARRYEADDPEVYSQIDSADGLFILDGNLRQQMEVWQGTRTESAIRDHVAAGKVLMGAGTGAQILGGVILDRRGGEFDLPAFLRHPSPASFTFTDTFLGFLPQVIIEPMLSRTGNLPALAMALWLRNQQNASQSCLGVGIDEHTAILINDLSQATILGEGAVTVLSQTASTTVRIDPRLPPVITDLDYTSFTEGFVLDLNTWQILAAPPDSDQEPTLPLNPVYQDFIMRGTATETRRAGTVEIANVDHEFLALQLGILRDVTGTGKFPGAIVVPQAYTDSRLNENRLGGLLWGLAWHHDHLGVLMDQGSVAEVTANGYFRPLAATEQPAILVIDPRLSALRAFSKRKAFPDSKGPRQSVAIVGARMHLLASRFNLFLPTGEIEYTP